MIEIAQYGHLINVLKVFGPTTVAFFVGILITPVLSHYLYKNKMWKKKSGKIALDGKEASVFNELHKERDTGTPRMGGVIIWVSTLVTIFLFWVLAKIYPAEITEKINFLSRGQTWLPLFTLVTASGLGLVDDWLQVRTSNGLSFLRRLGTVVVIGLIGGWWFYDRLEMNAIDIPFFSGELFLGFWFIPVFVVVMLALFSSSVIDGLDGLSGGVMAVIFSAYSGIAFFQNQINLAAFCAVVVGSILAFLWFNIPPARFYMSETGILGLTVTLTVVTFLTNTVLWLPIIALPLLATSASVIVQLLSKKMRGGKKVLLVAPLHHHFEALGWPSYKVVMRYWVISLVFALIGMILAIIGNIELL